MPPRKITRFIGVVVLLLLFVGCYYLVLCPAHSFYCQIWKRCSISESEEKDGIRITLWASKEYYNKGETIHVRATLKNMTRQTIILETDDNRPVFDVVYTDESGEKETTWSQRNPQFVTNHIELKPFQKIEINLTLAPQKGGIYDFEAHCYIQRVATNINAWFSLRYDYPYK